MNRQIKNLFILNGQGKNLCDDQQKNIFSDTCTIKTVKQGGGNMVWGCFSWYDLGQAYIQDGRKNDTNQLHKNIGKKFASLR